MLDTVSITELKQNTAGIMKRIKAKDKPLLVLQRSYPTAVILSTKRYEQLVEDLDDIRVSYERRNEPTVSFEEVSKKLGLK